MVPRGGIEPPTRGFSVFKLSLLIYSIFFLGVIFIGYLISQYEYPILMISGQFLIFICMITPELHQGALLTTMDLH